MFLALTYGPTQRLARFPKSKLDFWCPKLETNRNWGEHNLALLMGLEWETLEIWECQTKDRDLLGTTIRKFLG